MSEAISTREQTSNPYGEGRRIYSLEGGGFRDVLVHVPEGGQLYDGPKWPLIVALHGKTQSAEEFARQTGLSDAQVNSEFIVAYPTGLGYQWTGDPSSPPREQVNDVQFMDDLMRWMLLNYRVDPDRIFLAGVSNGAGLAALVACNDRLSQAVCAVAMSSTSIFQDDALKEPAFGKFETSRFPVPLLEFHGDADPIVDYNGVDTVDGPSWPLGEWLRRYTWMHERGLLGQTIMEDAEETQLHSGKVDKFVWRCGTESEIVVHYIIHGFGHGWPSLQPIDDESQRYGPTPVDATTIMLDFFRAAAKLERRPPAAPAPSTPGAAADG